MERSFATVRPCLPRLALLLACALLWLNTGAALHHTDDLSGLRTFASHSSRLHSLVPTPAASPCAACEWAQTLPTVPVTDAPSFAPSFARTDFAASLVQAPRLRSRLSSSPRAPPVG